MAYTPINWQTGDTITAEKLNRCDNGWGYENTQLFSETVTTTTDQSDDYSAYLSYSPVIMYNSIVVTFDGTDYECDRIDFNDSYFYGGFSTTAPGPDYTDYPFFIASNDGNPNLLYTETEGEHTIAVVADSVQCGVNFSSAVNSIVDTSKMPLLCVSGVTTSSEIKRAYYQQKRLAYFVSRDKFFIISQFVFSTDTDARVIFYPSTSVVSASITDGVFTVTES